MKIALTIVVLVITLTSCIKEVDYQVADVPRQLVVNSVISASHPVIVNVSGLQSIFDNSLLFIDNATVILMEETGECDTLSYLTKGNYASYICGKPGKAYRLTVMAEGYPTASATDTIPEKISINYATRTESETVDEWGEHHNDYEVSFTKEQMRTNYYELFFVTQKKLDSTYSINFESLTARIDPIILASGTIDFNYSTFLFSDATISDGEYIISMKMLKAVTGGGTFEKPEITTRDNANAAVLRTVSRSYYNYRTSWEKHRFFKNDSIGVDDYVFIPLMGEPQDMYSNIENGLGIFVAYNQDSFSY